jgi:hypothetical protein
MRVAFPSVHYMNLGEGDLGPQSPVADPSSTGCIQRVKVYLREAHKRTASTTACRAQHDMCSSSFTNRTRRAVSCECRVVLPPVVCFAQRKHSAARSQVAGMGDLLRSVEPAAPFHLFSSVCAAAQSQVTYLRAYLVKRIDPAGSLPPHAFHHHPHQSLPIPFVFTRGLLRVHLSSITFPIGSPVGGLIVVSRLEREAHTRATR